MAQAATVSSRKKRATATKGGTQGRRKSSKGPTKKAPARGAAHQRRADDQRGEALRNEMLGIGILAAALCLLLALASFNPLDVAPTGAAAETGRAHNLIGPVGASIADILLYIFGAAAFLLPLALALPGMSFLTGRRLQIRASDVFGYPLLVLFCAMAAHLWLAGQPVLGHDAGGMIGAHGAEILRALFGQTGAYILIYAVIALTFVLTTRISLIRLAGRGTKPIAGVAVGAAAGASEGVKSSAEAMKVSMGERFAEWRTERRAQAVERRVVKAAAREARQLARQERTRAAKATAEAIAERRNRPVADSDQYTLGEPDHRVASAFVLGEVEPEPQATTPAKPSKKARKKTSKKARATEANPAVVPPVVDSDVSDLDDDDIDFDDPVERAAFAGGDTVMAPALEERTAPTAVLDDRPTVAQPSLVVEPPFEPDALEEPIAEVVVEAVAEAPKVMPRVVEADQIEIPLPESQNYDDYKLPPLHLLDHDTSHQIDADPVQLQMQAETLVAALKTFKIEGRVTEIHPGPVVTMFEFEPAPGTRVSRISKLSDDLAMALKAIKVRIVAPIPGKGVVGFEVPNEEREMVFLKEIIGSPVFQKKSHILPMALGKDIHGRPAVTDLAKMPHLLVAGTTGSGKSVGVNGMITSLLYRYSPEEVRFIMVDPKMLELSIYEGIPHLLLPVVTDSKKAALALKWAVDEMERRYALMKDAGVRNIRGYNRKVEKEALEAEAARLQADADSLAANEDDYARVEVEETAKKVPFIVVVIDEFADLMMVAGKEVEHCVARIAQKARAAGIHLILATQRPSTDVITGVIKANFPTRMAFRVSSGIDSRTILSTNGAESLLGKGDMLYLPPGTSTLTRVHGAYVTEEEIHEIVAFIKAQQEPDYMDESVLEVQDESGSSDDNGADMDPMYEEAVRVVGRDGRASTSHLQRRLSLGYNRAARIVDQMERDGIVGPSNGAKPRVVNKPLLHELIERWDAA